MPHLDRVIDWFRTRATAAQSGSIVSRRHALGAVAIAGAASAWLGHVATLRTAPRLSVISAANAAPNPASSDPLASLAGARQWLNTPPLSAADLRGKVVLVNFWTYSCIYSLRALPYVRAWAEKYKDRGLIVIGVHAPEFGFEKNIDNVRTQLTSLGVGYPVSLDNDYAIWRAFDNEGWPGFYFIDATGDDRFYILGEGVYEKSERLIQQLLAEQSQAPVAHDLVSVHGTGLEAPPDIENVLSPETYIGYAKATNFASPGGAHHDTQGHYRTVTPLPLSDWSLAGDWTIGREFATLNNPSGSISFRFHARDLHLILTPSSPGQSVRFRVTIDGAPPGADHGFDVDADGWGTVQEPRLYQLVRQAGPVRDRTFEVTFSGAGVRAYSFTFG